MQVLLTIGFFTRCYRPVCHRPGILGEIPNELTITDDLIKFENDYITFEEYGERLKQQKQRAITEETQKQFGNKIEQILRKKMHIHLDALRVEKVNTFVPDDKQKEK